MKPIGSAQGKGIFLFTRLNEISEWKNDFKTKGLHNGKDSDVEAYVVQRWLIQFTNPPFASRFIPTKLKANMLIQYMYVCT